MKKIKLLGIALTTCTISAQAFCGFYVAKADGKLFNKSSQVIMVRNSSTQKNTITMANDYEGDFKEFAMVVPVPVVLREKDIKVVRKDLFERFDGYSAPRLAEYYDENPCWDYRIYESKRLSLNYSLNDNLVIEKNKNEYNGVTIEAEYEIGEYDILILSATESSGLKNWLTDNGYKIPEKANEVLTPYIKDDMKFFVAKVNTKRLNNRRGNYLSPLQISFTHKKFMLPIRLGMANSNGNQDLIVYALTQNGRVETSNYRTQVMPSNTDVPLFVRDVFGDFYKSVFSKAWTNNKSSAFVEYSWDLDGKNFTKCDPCNTTPPAAQELSNAGVDWLRSTRNNWGANYSGKLHFTRLHIRYNRKTYPQDLAFIETKNKENFQCRYVLRNPAKIKDESCDKVLPYYQKVLDRRNIELDNLEDITWWEREWYSAYPKKYENKITRLKAQQNQKEDENQNNIVPVFPSGTIPPVNPVFIIGFIAFVFSFIRLYKIKTSN
tara:strand:+ start:873 stop:2351 length:1479 start_codon:yes stop_codon:yes gene_type:complete